MEICKGITLLPLMLLCCSCSNDMLWISISCNTLWSHQGVPCTCETQYIAEGWALSLKQVHKWENFTPG